MLSQELKLPPQEIKSWSLSDLIDISASVLQKYDSEAMAIYFPDGYKPNKIEQEIQKRKMENN